MVARLRPYALHLYLLAYAPAMLLADGGMRDIAPQLGLGVVTFAVLWACTRSLEPGEARQVWICVAVATGPYRAEELTGADAVAADAKQLRAVLAEQLVATGPWASGTASAS